MDPTITADKSGALHVFWFEKPPASSPGAGDALFYTRWDGKAWSSPVDIFISPPGGIAQRPRAAVDPQGWLHVVWVSADSSSLFHSSAPALEATSLRAWTNPTRLAPDGLMMDFVVDSQGTLHVAYSQKFDLIAYVRSTDGGQTWSPPAAVAYPTSGDRAVEEPRLTVTPDGVAHVVWAEATLPTGWPPAGVLYARSVDGGETWSAAQRLSGPNQSRANIIATMDGGLLVVWSGTGDAAGRYFSRSTDGGLSWSNPEQFVKRVGLNPNALIMDGAGTVHLLTPIQRDADTYLGVDAMYYSSWRGQRWEPIQDIGFQGNVGGPGLAIIKGNELHAVVQGVLAADPGGIWHTSRMIDAPPVLPEPLPTIMPVVTATPTLEPNPTPTLRPSLGTAGEMDEPLASAAVSPWFPLVIGVLPVVILIIAVSVGRAAWIGRRR